ncbi:hypothetical protein CCP4SC76_4950003 [Gammaproteobacteria bacterium]
MQQLYDNRELRDEVLKLLGECLPQDVSRELGRKGLSLWVILTSVIFV